MSANMKQAYRTMKREQEEAYVARARKNEAILKASLIPFIFGDLVKVRDKRYPSIDYHPGEQKWFVGKVTMVGDAHALISFLEKRETP